MKRNMYERLNPWWLLTAGLAVLLFAGSVSYAQDSTETEAETLVETMDGEDAEASEASEDEEAASATFADVDTLWTCLAAFLVFFMQAGFSMVESGFTRAKNACNIMMKNLMDLSIGSVAFWMVGFGLMFGASSGWIGTSNFFYNGESGFDWAFLIFQTVFCATAATIVSGAMAERTKYVAIFLYTGNHAHRLSDFRLMGLGWFARRWWLARGGRGNPAGRHVRPGLGLP
jgi:ammonium transporter, Amt family